MERFIKAMLIMLLLYALFGCILGFISLLLGLIVAGAEDLVMPGALILVTSVVLLTSLSYLASTRGRNSNY